MNTATAPFVSIVTPVYNGQDFLAECCESVLRQSYGHFEYIIVNNCSTDRTLEIARSYAAKDNRIRVHNNKSFVGVIENHNVAFGLISPSSKFCKVVSADDFLFPDCLMRLVECGEANPSVGIVGSYQLSGSEVKWQGFNHRTPVVAGVALCRQVLLGTDKNFGFGAPTSMLYRADLVRRNGGAFYPNASPHADTSACFKQLQECDFGFVCQVLSYERIHGESQTSKSVEINRYSSACLSDLIEYGPVYLTHAELERQVNAALSHYHRFLVVNWFGGARDKAFWKYHTHRLEELGHPLRALALVRAAIAVGLQESLNPHQAITKLWKRLFPARSAVSVMPAAAGEYKALSDIFKETGSVGHACEPRK